MLALHSCLGTGTREEEEEEEDMGRGKEAGVRETRGGRVYRIQYDTIHNYYPLE